MSSIVIPILVVSIIGLVCGAGLSVASSIMAVKEDERFINVRACLPGANCGACGYSGCDGYAHALVEEGAKTNLCIPGADAVAVKVSEILGVEAEDVIEQVALVQCRGSCDVTNKKLNYHGIPSCVAAKMYFGGSGSCLCGCLGYGDCQAVCPNDAIHVKNGLATVDYSRCTGCGMCAKTCPQKIIIVIPDVTKTVVMCSNTDKGAVTRKICGKGCIGCKLCERKCEFGAVKIENNLAHIDFEKCTGCGACVSACPTGAISSQNFSGIHRQLSQVEPV